MVNKPSLFKPLFCCIFFCLFQSKTIAEQMAEKINAKLGYTPHAEEDRDLNGDQETFKRYEEELEINDFPQTARWKVTSKVSMQMIGWQFI